MIRKVLFSIIITAFFIAAYAQYSSELDVNVNNRPVMYIEMHENDLDFGDLSPEMEDISKLDAVYLTVKSNVAWMLTIEARDNLVSSNGDVIPSERLSVRSNEGEFEHMPANMPVILASGGPTGNEGESVILDFNIKINWNDPSGQYRTRLVFSLNSIY